VPAVPLELPQHPTKGVIELHGVHWPADSYEVLAFLNPPAGGDAGQLDDRDPHFVGRFFLYGSGQPRPDYAEHVDLRVRLRLREETVRAFGRPGTNQLVLVPRDANGRVLAHTDLAIGRASLEV
jgi:hypothetical protein